MMRRPEHVSKDQASAEQKELADALSKTSDLFDVRDRMSKLLDELLQLGVPRTALAPAIDWVLDSCGRTE